MMQESNAQHDPELPAGRPDTADLRLSPQKGSLRDFCLRKGTGLPQKIITLLLVTAIYYVSSQAAIMWTRDIPQAALLWLPIGFSLPALLLCGYRVAPAIFIGSFLANLGVPHSVPVAACIGMGHTAAPVFGVWAMRRFLDFNNDINRPKDIMALIFFPALLGGLIDTAIGVTSIYLEGLQRHVELVRLAWHWWMGDVNGILFVAPIMLVFLNRKLSFAKAFWREASPLIVGLCIVCALIFGPLPPDEMSGKFLIFPLMILAAYRFGQAGTIITLLITLVSVTAWRIAMPDISDLSSEALTLSQIYLATLAMTGLFLGAAVAERRNLEQQLRQYTQALERSNRELDDFTYIVSHDLKEPLRGLKRFSQFLLEDYHDKLDEDGKSKLDTISTLVVRLETLLDTLLYYSRLGRVETAVSAVRPQDIIKNVVDMLAISLKEKNTVVEIVGRLPVVRCNPVRIQEVFQNLISNALKYNDKPENRIEIGTVTDHPKAPGKTVFYVRDQGIGIAEKHLHVIFNIFKRLHASDAYGGGTGSGLAIVKKIIRQHGGDIWAESPGVGQGTTFYFTIPQI